MGCGLRWREALAAWVGRSADGSHRPSPPSPCTRRPKEGALQKRERYCKAPTMCLPVREGPWQHELGPFVYDLNPTHRNDWNQEACHQERVLRSGAQGLAVPIHDRGAEGGRESQGCMWNLAEKQAYRCSSLPPPLPFLCSRPQSKWHCACRGLAILLPQQGRSSRGPGCGSQLRQCAHTARNQHLPLRH